jgi:hypothetical protein
MIIAIKIPESFHGNSIILIPAGKQKCVSVECLREKSIELKTERQDHCLTRCIKDGKTSLANEVELSVFLKIVKIATYGFFKLTREHYICLLSLIQIWNCHASNAVLSFY